MTMMTDDYSCHFCHHLCGHAVGNLLLLLPQSGTSSNCNKSSRRRTSLDFVVLAVLPRRLLQNLYDAHNLFRGELGVVVVVVVVVAAAGSKDVVLLKK